MQDALSYIGNGDYWWISVITFSVIVLISGLMGFWNGWKTATYFLVWNVIAVIVGVFSAEPIFDKIVDSVNYDLPDGAPITSISSVGPYVGPLIMLSIISVANFLAFIVYWFVRKPLKRSIKKNKRNGISNGYARFIGMGVGVVAGLPSAVIMTDYASVTTTENSFTKFNNSILRGMTGTKFDGIDPGIRALLDLQRDENKKQMEEFAKLFDGTSTPDFSSGDAAKAKEKIE
ncbi:MAG: hypothetical protein KAG91_01515, partial [Mycoplasmataceae bacterium]|nr:hypothetical protein [Mycoplasmataceae bacterium]